MTSERIKEIQERTAYPNSLSVKQALLQVWNECEQEYKQLALTGVVQAKPEVCGKGCDYKRVSVSWMQCKFCKGMKN